MPIIKPISDLRNKFSEISDIVHNQNEPVFITKNGEGNMVVMSIEDYHLMQARLDLFSKLSVSLAQKASGDTGRPLGDVMNDIRKKTGLDNKT